MDKSIACIMPTGQPELVAQPPVGPILGPQPELQISLSPLTPVTPRGPAEQTVLVTVKGPQWPPGAPNPFCGAVDVVFVIDVSGSMFGLKLDQVKQSLTFVLNELPEVTPFCHWYYLI